MREKSLTLKQRQNEISFRKLLIIIFERGLECFTNEKKKQDPKREKLIDWVYL